MCIVIKMNRLLSTSFDRMTSERKAKPGRLLVEVFECLRASVSFFCCNLLIEQSAIREKPG